MYGRDFKIGRYTVRPYVSVSHKITVKASDLKPGDKIVEHCEEYTIKRIEKVTDKIIVESFGDMIDVYCENKTYPQRYKHDEQIEIDLGACKHELGI